MEIISTTLNQLLNVWQQSNSDDSFFAVTTELTQGNSPLFIPSRLNNGQMNIASIYEDRGINLLLTYSSDEYVTELTDEHLSLYKMNSQDVLKFCEANNISKIVINPKLPNEFLLQKPGSNTRELEEDVAVQIGRIRYQLPLTFLTKLIENFREVKEIEQVYIYSQKMNNEISTALGIVLTDDTQKNVEAANQGFKNALVDEKLTHPNFMIILNQDEGLLKAVQGIENALFYKKQYK
jgi:hypothetical protein